MIVRAQLPPHRSTAALADELVHQVEHLVQLEKQLAVQELKELAIRNGIAAGLLSGAGLLAMLAVFVGVPVLLVELISPHWLAALGWVVVYLVLAAALGLIGKSRLLVGAPPKTMRSLQETRDWALTQLKSNGK